MDPLRILVVDDSALFRTMLRNVLAEIPNCEVVATATDGRAAIQSIIETQPDLVTLDVEMPDLNGIDVLRELKRRGVKTKVLMISRLTKAGTQITTDALIEGAFDFILKPSGGDPAQNKTFLRAMLEERLSAVRGGTVVSPEKTTSGESDDEALPARSSDCRAVVIGCSTGGPDALAQIVPDLSANLSVPVFVVQHMPEGFTATLASRLAEASSLEVREAEDGMPVHAGQVVLARGGKHLRISRRQTGEVHVQLTEDPHEHGCRPAVDYTLRSAIDVFEGRILAVVLTGMGRDGAEGCKLLHSRGGRVLVQHSEGCTVYGMPKSVLATGVTADIVKLPRIAAAIERIAGGKIRSRLRN